VAAEASASGRENPYSEDCRAILELAGMVHSSDVRGDLIMLAAAYRRLANAASTPPKAPAGPLSIDPDEVCSRYLQDAFREEAARAPR
jgi:hypothetical protein